jgi:phosphopantothenate-cysteine ligase/phosphopantothenoylcysteine decarboxylase/phosphopantothenate--cysteine ligase
MGYAIASAALERGHSVTLISGPVYLPPPVGAKIIPVETAEQMYLAVQECITGCDAAVFSAAVADYRPVHVAEQKIKKKQATMALELERTPDILGSVRSSHGFKGLLCGFAAETENITTNAKEKLKRKGCDLLVANDVSKLGIGFDSIDNEIILHFANGESRPLPKATKLVLAQQLIQVMESML